MAKSRSRKSKSRGHSVRRTSPKRKTGPYAAFVKKNFHKYYRPGKSPKTAFKSAAKQVAQAYRRSH